MKNFGLELSQIDGSEHIFGAGLENVKLPKRYSFKRFMPKVLNQGENPICVPCSISAYLNWRENLNDGSKRDNKVKYFDIYDSKTTQGDGMTFKDAFKYLRHEGVDSKAGNLKIGEYAMVPSLSALKNALVANGPCVGALPVYNYNAEFWDKSRGSLMGYHAISIVGYDDNGIYIRNSWGDTWGLKGYTYIKNSCFNSFLEIWTIVS